jgi:hypothetical protein
MKDKNTKPMCLCSGLRRRNAGLCLKCEVSMLQNPFVEVNYEFGYERAKNDILRLLEQ